MRKSLALGVMAILFLAGCSSAPEQTAAEKKANIEWAMGAPEATTKAADPAPLATVSEPAALPAISAKSAMELGMHEDWGWPTSAETENITGFSEKDLPRVTVVTNLADKPENKSDAKAICNLAKLTIKSHNIKATGVYVTAGEGGAFLATCDV